MKYCPLTRTYCNPDCAWFHKFEDTKETDCAIKVLADVAIAEFNAYIEARDEEEVQENLYKTTIRLFVIIIQSI